MKVELKPLPLPPVMIGPDEAKVGDVVEYTDSSGSRRFWVTSSEPGDKNKTITINESGKHQYWGGGTRFHLLSRIGGMPTQSHRFGDLPIGAIVPGREIDRDGLWYVRGDGFGRTTYLTNPDTGTNHFFYPDTRIAVAYEPIELEEPNA